MMMRSLKSFSLSSSGLSSSTSSSRLEVLTPLTSLVEFQYTWPVHSFLSHVKRSSSAHGLDSESFEANVNGLMTKWSLSVRFWTGDDGERLANPFVVCLNLLEAHDPKNGSKSKESVDIKYTFGLLNRTSSAIETVAQETATNVHLEGESSLRSIGFCNVSISERNLNSNGDIVLVCRLRIINNDQSQHSLSSDLGHIIDDQAFADCVLETDDGKHAFNAHSHILAARSPVLAHMLASHENEKEDDKEASLINADVKERSSKSEKCHADAIEDEKIGGKSEEPEESRSASPVPIGAARRNPRRLKLSDIDGNTLSALLTYLYTDSSVSMDNLSHSLLRVSDRLQLPGLKLQCESHLGHLLNVKNVASMLMLADETECKNLKKSALLYCKDNHNYIAKDNEWKHMEEWRPELFDEAVSGVVEDAVCHAHTECIKRGGKRFHIERNSTRTDVRG